MSSQLDPQVQRLLFEHVSSFEQLEALLLLQRSPAALWDARQVAEALRLPTASVIGALAQLAAHHLLQVESQAGETRYRYAPSAELAPPAARLAAVHAERPLEIIQQMSANAIERLRSSAARAFSDAFLFRNRRE